MRVGAPYLGGFGAPDFRSSRFQGCACSLWVRHGSAQPESCVQGAVGVQVSHSLTLHSGVPYIAAVLGTQQSMPFGSIKKAAVG